MTDSLSARSPLHAFAFPDYGDRLTMTEEPYTSQLNVRARAHAVGDAGAAFGILLPTTPNTIAYSDGKTALWLGPDEWLVVGASWPQVVPPGVGVVDVSAQRTTIALAGPFTLDVLAFGCALDLGSLGGVGAVPGPGAPQVELRWRAPRVRRCGP